MIRDAAVRVALTAVKVPSEVAERPDSVGRPGSVNTGRFVLGLSFFTVSTIAAIVLRRHLDHPDNPRSAPGTTMILLIVNLVQVMGLAVIAFALFEPG